MKKTFLVFVMSLFVINSCGNRNGSISDDDFISNLSQNSVSSNKGTSESVGEIHNQYLEETFLYLFAQGTVNPSNIGNHCINYFGTIEDGDIASDYFNYVGTNGNFDVYFSTEFKSEIQNLNNALEAEDFTNITEFKDFISEYSLIFIKDSNEIIAWENYKDVFIHSFEYWEDNIDDWKSLGSNASGKGGSYSICEIYTSWWKRAWCNVKSFVGMDAAGAAGYTIGALISGNPVVIGAVGIAAAGASVRSLVQNIN